MRGRTLKAASSEEPFDKGRTQTVNLGTAFEGCVCRPLTVSTLLYTTHPGIREPEKVSSGAFSESGHNGWKAGSI